MQSNNLFNLLFDQLIRPYGPVVVGCTLAILGVTIGQLVQALRTGLAWTWSTIAILCLASSLTLYGAYSAHPWLVVGTTCVLLLYCLYRGWIVFLLSSAIANSAPESFLEWAPRLAILFPDRQGEMWRRRIRAVSLYTSGDQALGQSLLDQERGSLPIGEQSWNDLVLLMLYRYSSNWKSVIDIGEKIKAWPVKKGWPDLVRFYVARAYAQQGKLSKACEELDSIKGPYNARLLDVGLAGIRAVAGSQPALDRCLERTKLPEWNQLFLRGICLGTMGQVEDAKALLTRALDLAAQQPKLSAAWTQFIKSELKQLEGRNADTPVPDYSVEQARIEETYKRLLNALPTQLGAGTTVRSTTGGTTSAEPQTEEVLLPYAGFRLRFAAMAADGVLATLAGLCLILIPISWTNPQADWREVGKLLAGAYTKQGGVLAMGLSVLAVYAFGCCLCGVLVPLFESSRWQTTPGKWLFNLKVTDNNGRRIGIHKAYIKQILQGTFAGIFSILWPVYPATYLPIWSTRKQTLYDRILGRVVVIQYEQPSMFKKCIRTVALLAGLALSVLSVVWAYAAIQEIDQLTSSRPDHPHALTKQEGSAHTLK